MLGDCVVVVVVVVVAFGVGEVGRVLAGEDFAGDGGGEVIAGRLVGDGEDGAFAKVGFLVAPVVAR